MWFSMSSTSYRSCAAGFLDGTGFLGALVGNAFEPPGELAEVELERFSARPSETTAAVLRPAELKDRLADILLGYGWE
jgi:hypothetical protein